MRKVLLICLAVVLVTASMAAAQTVVGSKHDLSSAGPNLTYRSTNISEVCVFCHTPHQAAAANGQDPLWNHTLSATASYGVYASGTLNAVPTDIGNAVAGSASTSSLCMSCHDGTVGVGSLYNNPNNPAGGEFTPTNSAVMVAGNANVGTDLTNDHPVNFTYNTALATADAGLVSPFSAIWVDAGMTVPLYGGTVQCSSCHDPHDPTNSPFLVKSNSASGLCVTCHTK